MLVGEDSEKYYCMGRERYENSDAPKYAEQYRDAARVVTSTQKAIKDLGFDLDSQRFEEFGGVAEKQKEEFERKALWAMVDQALEASTMAADRLKSLNPWNVNNVIKDLAARGADFEPLVEALRVVARQKDKPAMAEAYRHFLDLAKAAKEGWDTSEAQEKDPENKNLVFLLGALKSIQTNPELGLFVTGAEFAESLGYLGYVSAQVDDLGRISDDKLRRLPVLSQRLKDAVAAKIRARDAWRTETGFSGATPILEPPS